MEKYPFLELKEQAAQSSSCPGFRVILDDEFEYDSAREISNSYFDKKPRAVAFPRSAKQVQQCLQYCIDNNQPFRTRSGGHQHEGMSSLNGGLMIRLSDMSLIEYENDEKTEAWIDSGIELGTVYNELARYGMIIPGGGCFTVNVGGLTQGGGWGMHARKHGLTCDSVSAVEIVLYDSETKSTKVEIVSSEHRPELFRALKGGGGGNFGIVTRFRFELKRVGGHLTWFRLGWKASETREAVKTWLDVQADLPADLTSFVRLSVMQEGAPETHPDGEKPDARDYPIYAGGLFYGTKKRLLELPGMKNLLSGPKPSAKVFKEEHHPTKAAPSRGLDMSIARLFGYDDFSPYLPTPSPWLEAGDLQAPTARDPTQKNCDVAPPSVNCDAPHPHKVSSAFSRPEGKDYNERLATAVAKHLEDSRFDPNVKSYMTFHAMGGKIADPELAKNRTFAYSDRDFLLQFQSWWSYPDDKECKVAVRDREQKYIRWVREFRKALDEKGLVEGAFINFVDRDLARDAKHPSDRKIDLLEVYYANELPGLMRLKKRIDPENRFDFEMSIPPA